MTEITSAFAAAEAAGDTDALAALLTDDFTLCGPVGFVVRRDQWLQQFGPQGLQLESVSIADVEARRYGDVAVHVGVLEQAGTFAGDRVDGRFRVTLIEAGGRLAGMHLSPIAHPAAA